MAVTADSVVVELFARTDKAQKGIEAYARTFDTGMKRVEASAGRAENAVGRSLQQQRAAYTNLSFQIQDITQQLSLGTNAFVVLAQQGGQTAAALSGFGGTVGRVAAFMSGPFGSAILGAVTVLGLLATKQKEAADSADKEEDATVSLKDALEDLAKASGAAKRSIEEEMKARADAIRQKIQDTIKTREDTKATLENARAHLQARIARASGPGEANERAALGLAQDVKRIRELEASIVKMNAEIAASQDKLRFNEGYFQATQAAAAATDKAAAATQRYDREVAAARQEFERSNKTLEDRKRLTEQLIAAENRRQQVLERARKPSGRSGSVDKNKPDLSPAEIRLNEAYAIPIPLSVEADGALVDLDAMKVSLGELMEVAQHASEAEIIDAEALERAIDLMHYFNRDLSRGLADAIVYGDNLGDVLVGSFKRAAAALVESKIFDLLQGVGGVDGGFFGGLASSIIGGRASGGHVQAGRAYLVGENGPELWRAPQSGKIYPTGALRAAPAQGGTTVVQHVHVDASNSVNPEGFERRILSIARQQAVGLDMQAARATLNATPARMSSYQKLGS